MSLCTILIIKKSETSKIQDMIRNLRDRLPISADNIVTQYYKQSDFVHVDRIHSSFEDYDILMIENYHSSFVMYSSLFDREKDKKIKKFIKQGWSESKIESWLEFQSQKNNNKLFGKTQSKAIRNIVFTLAESYAISFAYYGQGRDWIGFSGSEVITGTQESYRENVVYIVDEKMYKRVLNAFSYSLSI